MIGEQGGEREHGIPPHRQIGGGQVEHARRPREAVEMRLQRLRMPGADAQRLEDAVTARRGDVEQAERVAAARERDDHGGTRPEEPERGDPLRQDYTVKYRPELGVGDEADPRYLKSAVGLVWRTVMFWLFMIALLTLVWWV